MTPSTAQRPAVTVIIATYNRGRVLKLALESLLNQDFEDYEAWVVGDACTDDSEEVVRSFGDERLHWLNLEKNSGSQAAPNNAGLRLARGQYIAYLGHDDLWLPAHLSGLVDFIRQTNADLVHSLCVLFDPGGVAGVVGPPRDGSDYAYHSFPPSSWLHRRDIVPGRASWKDPALLPWAVDFDFTRQVFLAGGRIDFCPQLTVLKFPSVLFPGAYLNLGELPQEGHLRRLKENPGAVEHRVLLELATAFARQSRAGGAESWQAAFRHAGRVTAHWLYYSFARLGPLSAPARWYFQRVRRATRARRGLPVRIGSSSR